MSHMLDFGVHPSQLHYNDEGSFSAYLGKPSNDW